MPDRELTPEELRIFVDELPFGKVSFSALKIHLDSTGKPSLYDICIDELAAKISGLTQIIINQGIELNKIKDKLKSLE